MNEYPFSGFHFSVEFELEKNETIDTRFREVSGLDVTVETEKIAEGGENRFEHKLPKKVTYSDLVLKRGMFKSSELIDWCKDAMENFQIKKTNITVKLLNDEHTPLAGWYITNAFPIKWQISGFNAERGEVVIETITFCYNRFEKMNL